MNTGASKFKQVLNPWEMDLYNLLDNYFVASQEESLKMPVLSQVALTRIVEISKPYYDGIQINAMSIDNVVVCKKAFPKLAIEADGTYHSNLEQEKRDKLKDKILEDAGIPLMRIQVEGPKKNIEVLYAETHIEGYDRQYIADIFDENGNEAILDLSGDEFNDSTRFIEKIDLELELVSIGWNFPPNWKYATELWRTHNHFKGKWKRMVS